MPPQTRGIKTLKENITASSKNKAKNNAKSNRKPLADKTNSASDDNVSNLSSNKVLKEKDIKTSALTANVKERSRRTRRLPTRYEENNILKNLSKLSSNSLSPLKPNTPSTPEETPTKTNHSKITPHNTLSRSSNSPLVSKRPKRICRLPSKFDGHSLSPTKNCCIQPSHASTPISNKLKKTNSQNESINVKLQKLSNIKESQKSKENQSKNVRLHKLPNIKESQKSKEPKIISKQLHKSNSNKQEISKTSELNKREETTVPSKATTNKIKNKKEPIKNTSFRLLDDKKESPKRDSSKLDIYEFTFDPDEEPPPQKKKKKRIVKNPSKPKKVVKSVYDKNIERAMAALKNAVSSKQKTQIVSQENTNKDPVSNDNNETVAANNLLNTNQNVSESLENKYNSIRVEDIAMQFQETSNYDHNNIDYSPINSPHHAPSPVHPDEPSEKLVQPSLKPIHANASVNSEQPAITKDPLNLLDNLSFFDEQPVASSSINVSKDPTASPWRVEFNNLPIKWQVNSYVKPNMTPAIERSFVNYNDSQKKHVYTNIISDTNESIHDDPQPHDSNVIQTSIISFIKEVVEKKENKKRKNKVVKNNSLFEDTHASEHIPSRKNNAIPDVIVEERSNTSTENQSVNENLLLEHNSSKESERLKDLEQLSDKGKDKDMTYFGFDDSENQENVSPIKKKTKKKVAKHQTRSVLQMLNGEGNCNPKMPMPLAVMSKPARIANNINKVFEETKTATEPPAFPEQNIDKNNEITNVNDNIIQSNIEDDDSQSVHLFEDIELIHHLKPSRKSYGKSKKVTFHQNTAMHNEDSDIERGSSDEDNLDDLSFKLPTVKEKKVTKKKSKKQQKSKKEEKEAEAWAAGFNSMCEDIEEFDLVVE